MHPLPRWVEVIKDNPDYKKSFIDWIDEAVSIYAERALVAANSMEQLLGMRIAAGELRALKELVNYQEQEMERPQNVISGHPWTE